MGSRLEFHNVLLEVLGKPNVYYQPPPNIQITYPCIIYERDYAKQAYADDKTYTHTWRYQVTLVSKDPEVGDLEDFFGLPLVSFQRHYVSDNLHHYVFNVYF